MATTLHKDDILKAAQAMTKEERMKLIADIAALPDKEIPPQTVETAGAAENFDKEVMKLGREFMDEYADLLRRLAE